MEIRRTERQGTFTNLYYTGAYSGIFKGVRTSDAREALKTLKVVRPPLYPFFASLWKFSHTTLHPLRTFSNEISNKFSGNRVQAIWKGAQRVAQHSLWGKKSVSSEYVLCTHPAWKLDSLIKSKQPPKPKQVFFFFRKSFVGNVAGILRKNFVSMGVQGCLLVNFLV